MQRLRAFEVRVIYSADPVGIMGLPGWGGGDFGILERATGDVSSPRLQASRNTLILLITDMRRSYQVGSFWSTIWSTRLSLNSAHP